MKDPVNLSSLREKETNYFSGADSLLVSFLHLVRYCLLRSKGGGSSLSLPFCAALLRFLVLYNMGKWQFNEPTPCCKQTATLVSKDGESMGLVAIQSQFGVEVKCGGL